MNTRIENEIQSYGWRAPGDSLIKSGNRIQFEVNPTVAGQAGQNISSKRLALANIVEPETMK